MKPESSVCLCEHTECNHVCVDPKRAGMQVGSPGGLRARGGLGHLGNNPFLVDGIGFDSFMESVEYLLEAPKILPTARAWDTGMNQIQAPAI